MVPDSLGIVVEGAPPDQTFSHNVISTAHQNFLAALPSGFCWKFHQGESVLAATSNMNALDVKFSIQQCNVLSPADNDQLLLS